MAAQNPLASRLRLVRERFQFVDSMAEVLYNNVACSDVAVSTMVFGVFRRRKA